MEEERTNYVEIIHGEKAWYGIYQAAAGNYCVDNDVTDDCWCCFNTVEEARQFIRQIEED